MYDIYALNMFKIKFYFNNAIQSCSSVRMVDIIIVIKLCIIIG